MEITMGIMMKSKRVANGKQEDILCIMQTWLHQIHITQLPRAMMHFDMFGEGDENIPANPASNGVITTAAVWAIIMFHHLDFIAIHHQDNGNGIQLFKPTENQDIDLPIFDWSFTICEDPKYIVICCCTCRN
ncbi:uncharacterized protein LOC132613714 [Lycium barbarum]|uniref:uncharacterized protein LOC132613714 n=1 Tax=Lycium barbarum TaxID=112863 RepID=UPI00293E4F47|nr:uncharacterized protein LOC132613714 [Lycium barbarum]